MNQRATLWTFVGLSSGPAVAYGISRFAYGLLLPPMREDLTLTYSQAGAITTANNLGYLAGATLAAFIVSTRNARPLFVIAMLITAATLFLTALSRDISLIYLLRAGGGFTGAMALVAGGVLATQAGGEDRKTASLSISIYYAGGGLGILCSTVLVLTPVVSDATRWPSGWYLLSAMTFVCAFVGWLSARQVRPIASAKSVVRPVKRWLNRTLVQTAAAYCCFGLGHVGYITFVVAFLREQGISPQGIGAFWALVGSAAFLGAFFWAPVLTRVGGQRGLAAILSLIAIGAALPVFKISIMWILLSALLFGSSFLSAVAAVTYVVRGAIDRERLPAAIAFMTIVVGIGQSVGPLLVAYITESAGRLESGLMLPPVLLLFGAGLAMLSTLNLGGKQIPVTR